MSIFLVLGFILMALDGVSWTAFGYACGKCPRSGIQMKVVLFAQMVLTAVSLGIICVFRGVPAGDAPFWLCLLFTGVGGVFGYAQMETASLAMSKGPNGLIWAIVQSGMVFPYLAGILFFGSRISCASIAGIVAILLGILLVGYRAKEKGSGKWILATLTAFLSTGFLQIFTNLPSYIPGSDAVDAFWRATGNATGGILAFLLHLLVSVLWIKKGDAALQLQDLKKGMTWKMAYILSASSSLSMVCLLFPGMNYLAKVGYGAIAYPVAVASSILFFEVYSQLALHEKRTKIQIVALLLLVVGTIALTL